MKPRFVSVRNFWQKKKEQNYASFVLKFGTKKKIFFTIILTIYVCKQILSVFEVYTKSTQIRFSKSDEN